MHLTRVAGYTLMLMALAAPAVRADDVCGGKEERAKATAEARESIAKTEKTGNQADMFIAYQSTAADDCVALELISKARASMGKVGRDLAIKAERKGVLYSSEPIAVRVGEGRRANQGASAFAWLEAIGDYSEANRVLIKAVQTKPEDLPLFETAWNIDNGRYGPVDGTTGSRPPYNSPTAFRQELTKVASVNADRLMKAEEKDAHGLTGNIGQLGQSSMQSIEKLRNASLWMKFLPGGDKPARDRAEQRGDTIMKRPDPTFSQGQAMIYYEFSGSPKAKGLAAQIKKKNEESQQVMEKASESMKKSFIQNSEAEQKQFDKKKADLEKELGF